MKYPKIQSIYKRDDAHRFTTEFSTSEFEYLANNNWVGTEKIDGTNIRIQLVDGETRILGRTDKAIIPSYLLPVLQDIALRLKLFSGVNNITLYGEGYGYKIQKVGKLYLPNAHNFILFDARVGMWWLTRDAVDSIAKELNIQSVPVVFTGTLNKAIDMAFTGFKSVLGTACAEGIVLVPACGLLDRGGRRIITKVKTKDCKE